MPRLRQVALAAHDLESAIDQLRDRLGLGEPYRDPAVDYFGLANAVFAIGDSFLEVVSPKKLDRPGARTAMRQLERSGSAICGYMAMLQVDDLTRARDRARAAGVREVFNVELEDISEVHLHPADTQGAIVSLSTPRPAQSWRWGGEDWPGRAVPGSITGITVAVADPDATSVRWSTLAGDPVPGCRFEHSEQTHGIIEIHLDLGGTRLTVKTGEL